jgi:hypothetical protein
MNQDLEHATKATQCADQLVADLTALAASTSPAITRIAQVELYWAQVLAKRLANLAELAKREDLTEGIENIIAASHKFGEMG